MDNATSTYTHLYLGKQGEGPAPVFRDLRPGGVPLWMAPDGTPLPNNCCIRWRPGQVFAVYFARSRFPLATKFDSWAPLDCWEFFDGTGWPLDLPHVTRVGLTDATKRELQVYPMAWRYWDKERWQGTRDFPDRLRSLRRQTSAFFGLTRFLPPPPVIEE